MFLIQGITPKIQKLHVKMHFDMQILDFLLDIWGSKMMIFNTKYCLFNQGITHKTQKLHVKMHFLHVKWHFQAWFWVQNQARSGLKIQKLHVKMHFDMQFLHFDMQKVVFHFQGRTQKCILTCNFWVLCVMPWFKNCILTCNFCIFGVMPWFINQARSGLKMHFNMQFLHFDMQFSGFWTAEQPIFL